MSPDLPALEQKALEAVAVAGQIAMAHFRAGGGSWEKSPGQVVTEADLAIDRHLRAALLEPGQGWLSEETADDGSRLAHDGVWVADPIDGTRSFAAGKPEFTVCVGYLWRGRPVMGVVANPATGEVFRASDGAGAFLNDQPLGRRPDWQGGPARVAVSETEVQKRPLRWLMPEAEWCTIGSLALKLVHVAAGRFDAYLSLRRSNDWDLAAAAVILAEAGVTACDATGHPWRFDEQGTRKQGVVAAPPALAAALLARIAQANSA